MTDYLSYKFEDNSDFIDTFDEMPLWSASFGLLLLKYLIPKPNLTILDIGSGTGFPLMEIAGRFGRSCTCYGLDPWTNANNRARLKIKNYELANVQIIEGSADNIPLVDDSIDLIVSNLGINNFDQPHVVFNECHRVLKPGGKLALTTNLNGHWKEFYDIFLATLQQLDKDDLLVILQHHQEHRGTVASVSRLFIDAKFKVSRTFIDSFEMRFSDGSAFLNHYFVKLGWLNSWKYLLPQNSWVPIFTLLEQNLNDIAHKNGCLTLTVPMLFIEGEKSPV